MSRQKIPWLPVGAVAILGVAIVVMKSVHPAVKDDPEEIPSVQAAKDQEDALRLAREIDLPVLGRADKVVIEEAPRRGGRRLTLENPNDIKVLREALKPTGGPETGGMNAVTICFFRKNELIRKIWVFEGGEWGFERPSVSHTTGHEASLWMILEEHLK
jgi:hypothetical protein